MIDHDLERTLRTRFRAEAARAGAAPAALHASVLNIPGATPHAFRYRTPRVLLLAAVILLTFAVGGAVAIGSGLIRLPEPPDILPGPLADGLSTVLLQPQACDLTLDDDLALKMSFIDTSGVPAQLTVDANGRVVRGPEPWVPDEGIAWEQRTLTSDGLTRLLADVGSSGLRDCMQVPGPGPATVWARLGDEVVTLGYGGWSIRAPSQEDLEAGEELVARFTDPNLGAPIDEWVETEWLPYEPDRWQIIFHRFEGGAPCCWAPEDYQEVAWRDMTLPDGSTLLTVGVTHPDNPPLDFVETRCLVIPTADRGAWVDALGEGGYAAEWFWMLVDGPGGAGVQEPGGGGLQISMLPLLPAQEGCQGSIEPAPRENLIDDLDVCGLVPKSAGWASSDQGNGYAREDRGDGWASCEYDAPPVMGFVFASRHPVSTDDAPDVVAHQFGAGFITEEISGRPVYLNPCVEPDPNCSAAIAVSAEPLLVILVPDEHNSAEELRTWAELVIDSLAARNSD